VFDVIEKVTYACVRSDGVFITGIMKRSLLNKGVKMKLNKKMLVLAAVACFGMIQSATAREFGEIYKQCGLGALIAPHTPVVAIITNITWDLGTTAVISDATDGCSSKAGKMASLIHNSYVPLEQELAQGQGEYLNAVLATASCDEASKAGVVANVREDFAANVSSSDYTSQTQFEKSESLFNLFQASTSQCATKS